MNQPSSNTLEKLLLSVSNINEMEEISALVFRKVSGKINICFPIRESQRDNIHFLIETEKKINLFELSELTTAIKEKLGFDYTDDDETTDIIVELKNLFDENKIPKLFDEITIYSKENFNNVQNFLEKHYPQFFGSLQNEKVASSNPSSQFWNATGSESEKNRSLNVSASPMMSREHLLADKLFKAHETEILSLSPPEKEEFIKRLCKSVGFDIVTSPRPTQKV